MQQRIDPVRKFTAQAALGSTSAFPVQDWQHVFATYSSTGNANFTMKFQISNQLTQPDFSAAATPSNQWVYVQIKELITNSAIDGATGISQAWADAVRTFELNTNGQRRIWATITTYVAGAINLDFIAKNNQ